MQKHGYDFLSHVEYGDGTQGTQFTLDQHLVKPNSAKSLLLEGKPVPGRRLPRQQDSRNLFSCEAKMILSQDAIAGISY